MKTSNKLIGLGILVLMIALASVIIAANSSLIPKTDTDENDIVEELRAKKQTPMGDVIDRNLGKLPTNKLVLGGNHRYILDPSSEDVVVTGRSKYVDVMEELIGSSFFDAPIYHEVTSKQDAQNDSKVFDRITDVLYFRIGIKGHEDLILLIGNESKVTASELVELSSLKIVMDGASHLDARLKCDVIEMRTRNNAHVNLSGKAERVSITGYDNSNLECGDLKSPTVDIMMSDNSRLSMGATNDLSGIIRNNTYYNNYGFVSGEKVVVMDNAKFD